LINYQLTFIPLSFLCGNIEPMHAHVSRYVPKLKARLIK